jgi:hypothetical protein
VKEIAPVLDDDGVPLCSEACPLFVRTKLPTWSVQYGCSHVDSGDPDDVTCRPAIVAMVRALERATDEDVWGEFDVSPAEHFDMDLADAINASQPEVQEKI